MSILRALTVGLAALAIGGGAQAQPATAAPADSLKVTICGSSGPLPVRDRAKPCVAIEAGGNLYLVDVGPESVENLMLLRAPLAQAKAVFITHLHSDHIGDLGEFNMQSWVAGRSAPLEVVGPPGVEKLAAGFNLAYENDHQFRHAHHEHGDIKLPISAGLLKAKVIVIPKGADPSKAQVATAWSDGTISFRAILVQHSPATPAYAYRINYKGRSVVISGDTAKWRPLAEAAKGVDVLIHEAQNNDMTKLVSQVLSNGGNPRMASIMTDTLTYHTSPVEAAELAKMAGVKALVFYHLTQAGLPIFTPQTFTRGIEAAGFPNWRLAKDGMTIELPVGSDEVKFGQN